MLAHLFFTLSLLSLLVIAQDPFLEILTPNPTSGWSTTGPQQIQWAPPTDPTVNLDIQTENISGESDPQFLIQNVSASDGIYNYTPPSPIVESDEWIMRFIPIANHSAIRSETKYRVKRVDISWGETRATSVGITSLLGMGIVAIITCLT